MELCSSPLNTTYRVSRCARGRYTSRTSVRLVGSLSPRSRSRVAASRDSGADSASAAQSARLRSTYGSRSCAGGGMRLNVMEPSTQPTALSNEALGGCRRSRVARMCGIVGYVGPKAAVDVVVSGLRRLEYRGYDSAGVAVVAEGGEASTAGGLAIAKKAGKLANLEKVLADEPLPAAHLGIGHTRWATHGAPDRPQRSPAPVRRRPGRPRAQRHHRELPARCARSSRRRAPSCCPTPTPRSSRICSVGN